ncbi:MAG: PAS domain S-box protein, partial [Pseudomonadales bacterium]
MYHLPDHAGYAMPGLAALLVSILFLLRPNSTRSAFLRFVQVFEHAPAGLLLLDLDGHVEWLNTSTEKILGQPLTEVTGQPLATLLTGDAWETLQTERRRLLDGHRVDLEGYYLDTTQGRSIWTRAYANLLRNELNKPEFIVIQLLDLTETLNANSAASSAESRFLETLDLITDFVITLDHSGRIKHANTRAIATLGTEDAPLANNSILDYIGPEDRSTFIGAFKACQNTADSPVEFPGLKMLQGGRSAAEPAIRHVSATMIGLQSPEGDVALVCQDIHEQLASLEQLRSSEARFSRIFHSSPDAILIVRQTDSLILDFNASFTRLLGYSREDAIGFLEKDLELFVDPQERTEIARQLESSSETTDLETRLRAKTGELVNVEISLRYIEIDGELCTLCIGRDITTRRLAESALRASEEKFEQVFSRSPDGIVILKQSDLSIYDINDSFLLASDYSRAELLGKSVYDLNVFDHANELEEATSQLAAQGSFSSREMQFIAKSGRRIQSLVSATFIEINEVPCILCIVKNVNDLRQAEENLKLSEQRFRGAFENSPVGIVLIDIDGNIFQANNFATEVLGYEKNPLDGIHISRLIPPEDRGQLKETLDRLLNGGD